MIPLYPVNHGVGGLEVVPDTNNDECQKILNEEYFDILKYTPKEQDFCGIHPGKTYYDQAKLVKCNPGDLILWDSRTVHGGRRGIGDFSHLEMKDLARLS